MTVGQPSVELERSPEGGDGGQLRRHLELVQKLSRPAANGCGADPEDLSDLSDRAALVRHAEHLTLTRAEPPDSLHRAVVVLHLFPGCHELGAFVGWRGALAQTHRLEQLADGLQADLHGQHELDPCSEQRSPCRAARRARERQTRHADARARPTRLPRPATIDRARRSAGRPPPGARRSVAAVATRSHHSPSRGPRHRAPGW